jgi:spermidine synthase
LGKRRGRPGYDTVVLGQTAPLRIDAGAVAARLARPDHARAQRALGDLRLGTAVELLATYAGSARDLQPWLRGAEINQDRSLRLQYLAGLHLNATTGADAYGELLAFRTYAEDIFTDRGETGRQLQFALTNPERP